MLAVIAKPYARLAGAVLLSGALMGGFYWHAYRRGAEAVRIENLKAEVEAFKNRSDVDAKVQSLGDYDLCIHLGGLPDDCAVVRGLDESAPAK